MRRRPALSNDAFAAVLDAYTALKRRRGVVDFDDLLAGMLGEMRQDLVFADVALALPPPVRRRGTGLQPAPARCPRRSGAADPTSVWRAITVRPSTAGNGADPTTLLEVETHYPGVTVVSLTGNYRCFLAPGRPLVPRRSLRHRSTIESRRPDGRPLAGDRMRRRARRGGGGGVDGTISCTATGPARGRAGPHQRTADRVSAALGRRRCRSRAVGTSVLDCTRSRASRCTSRDQLAH
ncbi:MAG: hypothetical protein R2713_00495 [Ilumatobacteraceae bacterium]